MDFIDAMVLPGLLTTPSGKKLAGSVCVVTVAHTMKRCRIEELSIKGDRTIVIKLNTYNSDVIFNHGS